MEIAPEKSESPAVQSTTPTNNVDGVVGDIWIVDGKIVSPPADFGGFNTIDAAGRTVMAGGIDMHCHIAGSKVNSGRQLQPEQSRAFAEASRRIDGQFLHSGSAGSVPTIFTTGYKYTGLGYTTCFDAAITPMGARQAHFEFDQIPNVDTGFFSLIGNNHYAMHCAAIGDQAGLESFLGWLMNRVGAYAPKIVKPGAALSFGNRKTKPENATDLDQSIDGFDVDRRAKIIQSHHASFQRHRFASSRSHPHE